MLENVIQIKSEITLNTNVECKSLKKHHVHKKDYIWDPTTCSCENGDSI